HLDINDWYNTNMISSDRDTVYDTIRRGFTDGADKSLIKLTRESLYSVTPADEARYINSIIREYIGNDVTITDATANVGGNAIAAALEFNKVIACEIDPKTFTFLQHNVSLYNVNMELHCGDFTKLYMTLPDAEAVIIYPPCGGISYKFHPSVELFMSSIPLHELVQAIQYKYRIVCLKVPNNYHVNELYKLNRKIFIYNVKKYKL